MKRSPIGQRMQSYYFEFMNEDGTTEEVLTDTEEGIETADQETEE